MLRYMLDTDTVSYALRGLGGVGSQILQHRPSELCISAITEAELRFGASKRGSRKLDRLIDSFTTGLKVAPFDERAAAKFGTVAADLVRHGTPIGDFDTLIAAHALMLDVVLVTNNAKHFQRVKGLKTANWI